MRLLRVWAVLALASLAPCVGRTQAMPPDPFPGMQLRARLEAHLESRRDALTASPGHYGLVFDLEPERLRAFMRQIRVHRDGDAFVLGTASVAEAHGGGVLALLLDHWRPGGRRARLADRYPFETIRGGLELAQIYRGYRRQLYLPVPGREPDTLEGELPRSPQIPRMRFRFRGARQPVETDSYKFLGVLLRHEADPSATWNNHLGQELSVDRLLGHARDHYLTQRHTDGELADHSRLHLVELALAYDRRRQRRLGAAALKERFLEVELAREAFERDWSEVVGHYAESLGLLLAEPDLHWSERERRRVRDWLARLERQRFRDLEVIPLQHLCHLLRGLRLVAAHRAKLEPATSAVHSGSRFP